MVFWLGFEGDGDFVVDEGGLECGGESSVGGGALGVLCSSGDEGFDGERRFGECVEGEEVDVVVGGLFEDVFEECVLDGGVDGFVGVVDAEGFDRWGEGEGDGFGAAGVEVFHEACLFFELVDEGGEFGEVGGSFEVEDAFGAEGDDECHGDEGEEEEEGLGGESVFHRWGVRCRW